MGGSRQEDCCDRRRDGATFFLQWGICGSLEQVGGFSSSPCGDKLSVVPDPVGNSGGEVAECPVLWQGAGHYLLTPVSVQQ